MGYQTIDVQPLSGALGAELLGVDLSAPLDNATFSDIHQAFHEYLVIFFRDQKLTPQQHCDFARRFGQIVPHPYVQSLEGYPEIIEIVKRPDEVNNWGETWHADMTFRDEPPNAAVLYAREVPASGGDTLFANMYLAYETLSEGMKQMLDGLEAVHESGRSGAFYDSYKGMKPKPAEALAATHPVVRTHRETGRKALFVNRAFTRCLKDMADEESRPILEYLYQHSTRPEFTCRFRWKKDSIAVWDNRVTMHNALNDDFSARRGANGFRRVMHRATIAGERPA
ncbi:MAG: TauD/TfdA family dioxygenase [Gammaproteobacteria bacterium]|nr:TauD/TfdA family dioxygenase [Gammaproteobacteria bacterium]